MRIGMVKLSEVIRTGRLDAAYHLSGDKNELVWEAAERMATSPERVRELFDNGVLIVRDGRLVRP